jgi:uncharacterized protein (DUF3820 family)
MTRQQQDHDNSLIFWPWGQYRGYPLQSIPVDYLVWVKHAWQDRAVVMMIQQELDRRGLHE